MIRRLFFGSDPGARRCEAERRNTATAIGFNLYAGDRALLVVTFIWLIFRALNYQDLLQRPAEIFEAEHWFGRLFMAELPAPALWWPLWGVAVLLVLGILMRPVVWPMRLMLTGLLLWINIAQWSYGFNSHVCYLFLLAHIFSVFIPFAKPNRDPMPHAASFAAWLYGGMLLSYTLSGFWKVVGLVYKLTRPEEAVTWIDADAALFNSVVSFRNYDLGYERFAWSMGLPIFWQISFWLVMFLQLGSVLFAGRFRAHPWIMVFQIGFHLVNIIFFSTTFWTAQFVLLAVFFPYHLVFKGWKSHATSRRSTEYVVQDGHHRYTVTYIDGSQSVFTGFGALRERFYRHAPIIGGLMYFPGVASVGRLIWG